MRKHQDRITLSATDLSNHAACNHVSFLNLNNAHGVIEAPMYRDPTLAILQERGQEFEQTFLRSLQGEGLSISIPNVEDHSSAVERTITAMRAGYDYIYQASLERDLWQGKADFLKKVSKPSNLGEWSYEVIDTKLAKETRAGTILQICLYTDMVADLQGLQPEWMHVITPEGDFTNHRFRVTDYMAYYRSMQRGLLQTIANGVTNVSTYPTPVDHCDICRWWQRCDKQRRSDDHLSLVSGMSGRQTLEINQWGISTVESLAALALPIQQKPARGSVEAYTRVREQARVQVEARHHQKPVYELLELTEQKGLFKLPEPSAGDIFFDFEGDPFVGTSGLEYLFGHVTFSGVTTVYTSQWALDAKQEKIAFENFIDVVIERLKCYPTLHIYHFTAYEPSALKRLAGKYATRMLELDHLLRSHVFVDLYSITKQTLRAGIEKYSLKDLEVFHAFERKLDLKSASHNLRAMERMLESGTIEAISEEIKQAVQQYNHEDCTSTLSLRNWLEELRTTLIKSGQTITRPTPAKEEELKPLTEDQLFIQALYNDLVAGLSPERAERNNLEQAKWLLANMLDWYKRESKTTWWEYFRLLELQQDELLDEKSALAGLVYTNQRRPQAKSFIDLYTFPPQDCEIRVDDTLYGNDGEQYGKVISISYSACTIEILKGPKNEAKHPASIFKFAYISDEVKEKSILRMGIWVRDNGIDGDGDFRAGRDLLIGHDPRINGTLTLVDDPQKLAVNWVHALNNGVLPIQGPPGAGKSHTAAEMILSLVASGKKVGITAQSHKVIRNLLNKVMTAAQNSNVSIKCFQRVKVFSENNESGIIEFTDQKKLLKALEDNDAHVIAGTSWLWANEDLKNAVDVLFIDEAGQFSLIDALAVSQAAKNIVLLGDPQQLKSPQQGSHPEGTELSALEHILQGEETIAPQKGIFLMETWRLHPTINKFISELFYEGRLHTRPDLYRQCISGNTTIKGAGIMLKFIEHHSNQSRSAEEVMAIDVIIKELCKGDVFYTDKHCVQRVVTFSDVMVIAPYNAQVAALSATLPKDVAIGTVDKFQGQEAPIVIYSMTTSSPEDAPRGMEFLYSLNRLNVAVSRAKSICIILASPALFKPNCKNPLQMKLANALCRYVELSEIL